MIAPKHVVTATVTEAATASATQDAAGALVARYGMLDGVYVNSSGTVRQANVNGTMVNL